MNFVDSEESKQIETRETNEGFNPVPWNEAQAAEARNPLNVRQVEETHPDNQLLSSTEDPQGLQSLIDEYPQVFNAAEARVNNASEAKQSNDVVDHDHSGGINDFLGEFNDLLAEGREGPSNTAKVQNLEATSAESFDERHGEDPGSSLKRPPPKTSESETSSKKRKSSPRLNLSDSYITSLVDNEGLDYVKVPGKGVLRKQAPSTLEDYLSGKLQMSIDSPQTVLEQSSRQSQTVDDQSRGHVSPWNRDMVAEFSSDRDQGSSTRKTGQDTKKRLVWTPALHVRFVKAINMVGMENAVPKTILELMNVKGLTTEHVKSHLQKFRNNLRKAKSEDLESSGRYRSPQMLMAYGKFSSELLGRGDPQRVPSRASALAQIEAQLELQEKSTQIQLQMQMIVHRTKSLHRKVLLSIERIASLGAQKEGYHNFVDPAQLGQEQRELQAQLEEQQQLLRQQIEEQEEVRRQLLQCAEGYQ
eukprot:CAMPEP_0198735532 /NCGR_PEP_ID=MMETSP1475-20131203/60236_1 /TAXON_ID= ORGANISM="Unidentified sp., Strain CCMP1999" /NCGR_SAMPLE_ID=MMETSP1475 /ASSEMBLY_ACC=CAM_ASM_001111 /LENGTH=473 /DNA_ID=CAMNT_0044499209 /DNA_START=390 /DNA_END=1811 /DNA_ORIENTATION=-